MVHSSLFCPCWCFSFNLCKFLFFNWCFSFSRVGSGAYWWFAFLISQVFILVISTLRTFFRDSNLWFDLYFELCVPQFSPCAFLYQIFIWTFSVPLVFSKMVSDCILSYLFLVFFYFFPIWHTAIRNRAGFRMWLLVISMYYLQVTSSCHIG